MITRSLLYLVVFFHHKYLRERMLSLEPETQRGGTNVMNIHWSLNVD